MNLRQFLQVALREISPVEYQQSTDRILGALDKARNKIVPAATRTIEQQEEVIQVFKEATCEIAKTYLSHTEAMDEFMAYMCLSQVGGTISLPDLKSLLEKTLGRLSLEATRVAQTA